MWQGREARRVGRLTVMALLVWGPAASSQTISITNDSGGVLSGNQLVNVGEHVRLKVAVTPPGTPLTNVQWTVAGTHLKDWIVKEGTAVAMTAADLQGTTISFLWKDVTPGATTNSVTVNANAGAVPVSATAQFKVERAPKAEKFYSDDYLMEYHNNWHSVWMFSAASTRRGDLFLAWHRSQLEYFNQWRSYFGYPPVPFWDPVTSWTAAPVPAAKQHPSTAPPPAAGFSTRLASLVTLDLTDAGLATATEGEYDLATQSEGRGTNAEFVSAQYRVRTETVKALIGAPGSVFFSKVGLATRPTWWKPNTGQVDQDPWFANGCPARATPASTTNTSTCAVQSKKSYDDYTLRELGESVESGWYADTFRVNYHALGHIAASVDMSDPITSMRDPIFWGWHSYIDKILSDWQATKGVEAKGPVFVYGAPNFSADWSKLRVAFSHRIVPELLKPGNVTVNDSPATAVTDVSLTGTGYIFEFSGYAMPPAGSVKVAVRREVNNGIRTSLAQPRPAPTLIMSTYGNLLTPSLTTFSYTKP